MSALAFWKTAHILSAAVLFGTGLGIAFFCWFSYRSAIVIFYLMVAKPLAISSP